MWLLFEIGVLFGGLVRKRSEQPDEEADKQPVDDHNDQPPATQP
jgi:sec-independent protein translocase protein TatC